MEFKEKTATTKEPAKTTKESSFWKEKPSAEKPKQIDPAAEARIKLKPIQETKPKDTAVTPEKLKNSKFHGTGEKPATGVDPKKIKDSKFHRGQTGTEAASPAAKQGETSSAKPKQNQQPKQGNPKLSDTQIKDAKAWYAKKSEQYTPGVIKEIQAKLGLPKTGKIDTPTLQGIAKWQRSNKPLPYLISAAGVGAAVKL